jgi:hypothetical protein
MAEWRNVMIQGISEKAQKIARKKRLTPVRVLYHDYVILCTDEQGRKVVLKTDNMEHEPEIHSVLTNHFDSARWPSLDIVRFLEATGDYIIMEFVGGVDPYREIVDGERDIMRFRYFPLIVRAFWELKDFLSRAARDVSAVDVEMTKPGEPTVYEWLRLKPAKWGDYAKEKYGQPLLPDQVRERLEEAIRFQADNPMFQRPLVPQFGVYGPHQMIIRDGRVVLFDFGGHLKWRPELYDAVWPLWWQLLHFKEEWLEGDRREDVKRYIARYENAFWQVAPEAYTKEVSHDKYHALFLAVLVERLVGCHIDILKKTGSLSQESETYLGKLATMVDDLLAHYAGEFKALPH